MIDNGKPDVGEHVLVDIAARVAGKTLPRPWEGVVRRIDGDLLVIRPDGYSLPVKVPPYMASKVKAIPSNAELAREVERINKRLARAKIG